MSAGEKIPAMTVYVPTQLKIAHQQLCNQLGIRSQSERIRILMESDLAQASCNILEIKFDMESAQNLRNKYKSAEERQIKILQTEILSNRRSAYDEMVGFAMSFGTDAQLVKNIEEVTEKLKHYDCTGAEPFTDSCLMTFILYVEAVVARRKVDAEIKSHWRKPAKPELVVPLPVPVPAPAV
jgi:hypothetical protein